jgi:ribonuclease Z
MSIRRFTALGTASQVPNTLRNQHSSFLKWDSEGFLFDPGENTQQQMMFSGISASEITKIFITHFHGDHCLGLSSILQRLSLDKVKHAVQIYFPASGKEFIDHIRGVASYYDVATIDSIPVEQEGVIYGDGSLIISAQRLEHTIDTFGYRVDERDSCSLIQGKLDELGIAGPAVGLLKSTGKIKHSGRNVYIKDVSVVRKGQSFAFVMDTRVCKAAIELARDVDLLVTESTFMHNDVAKAYKHGHLTARQAAEIAAKANAGMLLLTHFSQRYGPYADFASEARQVHNNVIQLNDNDTYELVRSRNSLG